MSLNKADAIVLYAPIKDADISVPLHPKERYNEVLRCKNDKAKTEKYLVWKLLEKAVKTYTNLDFANLQFTKTDNGKWICPQLHFSLSHADGLVCVAVSDRPIGVDAEAVKEVRGELESRILTDKERSFIKDATEDERRRYLLESWVKKESIFKRSGAAALLPSRIEADEHHTSVRPVLCGGREYLIAVCHGRNDEIKFNYVEEI